MLTDRGNKVGPQGEAQTFITLAKLYSYDTKEFINISNASPGYIWDPYMAITVPANVQGGQQQAHCWLDSSSQFLDSITVTS